MATTTVAMKLSLVSIEKGFVKIAAAGPITAADVSDPADNPMSGALGAAWAANRVLLDFSRVPYIDSSAIGWLITCQRAFRETGGAFVVYAIQPGVRQIIDMLKIGRVVAIAENEADARKIVDPKQVSAGKK